MVEYGVAPENLKNLISKDDIANLRDGDAVTCSVYDTKQKVKIDNVIGDHGLYAPSRVNDVATNSNTVRHHSDSRSCKCNRHYGRQKRSDSGQLHS